MTSPSDGEFDALIARPETHVALQLQGDAKNLLILFGGIAGGVSMPVFEFFRQTATLPGKKAFLRDPRRGWYQLGIPGIGETAQDVRAALDSVIAEANVDRVVMAGASAGGYAALLFGAWCGVDHVLAFSPQSFVDAENRLRAGDDRWPEQIASLHASGSSRQATLDLLGVLPQSAANTRFHVHVSSDDALDLVHAERLATVPGLTITRHERGGHRLVKTLRDRGVLQPMLLQVLSGHDETSGSPP